MKLRFHWMLPKAGELGLKTAKEAVDYRTKASSRNSPARLTDIEGWTRFARSAEEAGLDSLLVQFSRYEPDSLQIACALGQVTKKMTYMVACRSGLIQPAAFVQQVNTLSLFTGGRVSLNVVAGSSKEEQHGYGDFLSHDERYARADEFLQVCHAFWQNQDEVDFEGNYYRVKGGRIHTPFTAPEMKPVMKSARKSPEIYVSGHSKAAEQLAIRQGTCWVRVIDTPEKLAPIVARAREQGIEVCLRFGIVCRDTREEAIQHVKSLLPEHGKQQKERLKETKNDSQMYREATEVSESSRWLNPTIWTGFVPYYGPIWTTLLGTPAEMANAFLDYKRIGITQFIMSGLPELDEVIRFGQEVIPLVRQAERELEQAEGA